MMCGYDDFFRGFLKNHSQNFAKDTFPSIMICSIRTEQTSHTLSTTRTDFRITRSEGFVHGILHVKEVYYSDTSIHD